MSLPSLSSSICFTRRSNSIESGWSKLILLLSNIFQVQKKVFFFFFGFILFGTLSFISNDSIDKNASFDNEVVLLNNEDLGKQNEITENNLNNTNESQNEYALIIGSYNQPYNAKNLELEMKNRGFKDCSIISNENLNKYWVVLKRYKSKNQAIIDRERYLLDGWIKQL